MFRGVKSESPDNYHEVATICLQTSVFLRNWLECSLITISVLAGWKLTIDSQPFRRLNDSSVQQIEVMTIVFKQKNLHSIVAF